MTKRPTKCPICGGKITRVTNAVTKNSYFKCSNEGCHFVLGEDYTEAEFDLQGRTLNTICIKCHKPLTVANGPHGLYARCFNCDCDIKPTTYNGKTYQRWANTHKMGVSEEIESLIKNFNAKGVASEDKLYDFEAFISSGADEVLSKKENKPESTNCEKILTYLESDLSKGRTAEDISEALSIKIGTVRTSLLNLRTLELIKIVGFISNKAANHTILYQSVGSLLPEMQIFSKEDGYDSINSFLKNNIDKYGSVVRAKEVLLGALKKNNVKPSLFRSTRGIGDGYQTLVMEKLMDQATGRNIKKNAKKEKVISKKEPSLTILSRALQILQENPEHAYSSVELAHLLNTTNTNISASVIKPLMKSKEIKIVGWDYQGNSYRAVSLQYQLSSSPLPKFKVSVDNHLYSTLKQFYHKRIKNKKILSFKKLEQVAKTLGVVPLLINSRAYPAYSVADLKEATANYLKSSARKKVKTDTPKRIKVDLDIETAVMISQNSQDNITSTVSNPIKKKSFFNTIASLFKKKEKVHS